MLVSASYFIFPSPSINADTRILDLINLGAKATIELNLKRKREI